MPMARAASATSGGWLVSPVRVFSKIGRRPYRNSATSVGPAPKPITGTASASTATGGKVCPTEVTVRARGRNSRPAGRVTRMPKPTATTVEATTAKATSPRCDKVRLSRLVWV